VINIACDTALIEGYARMAKRIDDKVVRDVLKDLYHLRNDLTAQKPRKSPTAIKPVRGASRYRSLAFPSAAIACALIVVLFLIVVWYFPLGTPMKGQIHLNRPIGKDVEVNRGATDTEAETIPQATAERGSNLIQMTRRHYGCASPFIIDMVLEANPSITDMHVIFAKQGIAMPPLSEDSLILTELDKPVKIHLGTYVRRPPPKIFHNEPLLKGKLIEIVERKVSPRDTWYRVLAGPFSTREEATTTISALRGKGFLRDLSR
jgi:phage tail protein X